MTAGGTPPSQAVTSPAPQQSTKNIEKREVPVELKVLGGTIMPDDLVGKRVVEDRSTRRSESYFVGTVRSYLPILDRWVVLFDSSNDKARRTFEREQIAYMYQMYKETPEEFEDIARTMMNEEAEGNEKGKKIRKEKEKRSRSDSQKDKEQEQDDSDNEGGQDMIHEESNESDRAARNTSATTSEEAHTCDLLEYYCNEDTNYNKYDNVIQGKQCSQCGDNLKITSRTPVHICKKHWYNWKRDRDGGRTGRSGPCNRPYLCSSCHLELNKEQGEGRSKRPRRTRMAAV
mmetsp:Transcript_34851/g.70499  ORF Transcript_34851/g.70499 Transcript_34851/m.70499 type:complete len:288 (-) Transcript_34851:128-991(-)